MSPVPRSWFTSQAARQALVDDRRAALAAGDGGGRHAQELEQDEAPTKAVMPPKDRRAATPRRGRRRRCRARRAPRTIAAPEGGEAADLRRAGAGRLGGVDAVDVEGDIDRAARRRSCAPRPSPPRPAVHQNSSMRDDADAGRGGELAVLAVVGRAADADLDMRAGVEQALLHRAAEGRAVGVARSRRNSRRRGRCGCRSGSCRAGRPSPARAARAGSSDGRRRPSAA